MWNVIRPAIKRWVNGDLTTPLNHLHWINDLKMFGERSYVFSDPVKLAILSTNENALRDPIVNLFLLEGAILHNLHVGNLFAAITSSDSSVFSTLSTMDEITTNITAMNIIVTSDMAMQIIASSSLAMEKIAASSVALKAIAASTMPAARDYIESSIIAGESLYNSPLKQSVTSTSSTTWTNRRSGKVWLVSHRQTIYTDSSNTIGVGYTINNNSIISTTMSEARVDTGYRIDRFMTGIRNRTTLGTPSITYQFISCE